MSNKRNRRRGGQRVRSEVSRKPTKITKAAQALVAAQPAERKRKAEARDFEKWRRTVGKRHWLGKPRRQRKPRTSYGHTFWNHSHDV